MSENNYSNETNCTDSASNAKNSSKNKASNKASDSAKSSNKATNSKASKDYEQEYNRRTKAGISERIPAFCVQVLVTGKASCVTKRS